MARVRACGFKDCGFLLRRIGPTLRRAAPRQRGAGSGWGTPRRRKNVNPRPTAPRSL